MSSEPTRPAPPKTVPKMIPEERRSNPANDR
jgi:hypothetical protein